MRISVPLVALAIIFGLATTHGAQATSFFGGKDKSAAEEKYETAYEILKNQKNLDRFVDFISEAGLKDLFNSKTDTVTVFAPSNSAISDISSANMKHIKTSKENLQSFVKGHVIVGSRVSSSAMNGRKFSSAAANGENIVFDGTGKDGVKINGGTVTVGDLQAGNSLVYVVSSAFVPSNFIEAPKVEDKALEDKKKADPKLLEPKVETAAPIVDSKTVKETNVPMSGKDKETKSKISPLGAAAPSATTTPVGSSAPIGSTVTTPSVPAAQEIKPKSKGFDFFGHHFGG